MSQFYLSVPIQARGANLMSNSYLVGLPGLTGIMGFTTAMEMSLSKAGVDLLVHEWAMSLSKVDMYQGEVTPAGYMNAQRSRAMPPSAEFRRRGDLEGILYLLIESDHEKAAVIQAIINWLPGARFCSGTITPVPAYRLLHGESRADLRKMILKGSRSVPHFFIEDQTHTLTDNRIANLVKRTMRPKSAFYEKEPDITEIISIVVEKRVGKGDSEKPFASILTSILKHHYRLSADTTVTLEDVLDELAVSDKELIAEMWSDWEGIIRDAITAFENTRESDPYEGYMVPTHMGYVGLEAPTVRNGVRVLSNGEEPLSCLVEPQIGIARMRSHYSVCLQLSEPEDELCIFFAPETRGTPTNPEYIVTAYQGD
jgi:hypothetical protein